MGIVIRRFGTPDKTACRVEYGHLLTKPPTCYIVVMRVASVFDPGPTGYSITSKVIAASIRSHGKYVSS